MTKRIGVLGGAVTLCALASSCDGGQELSIHHLYCLLWAIGSSARRLRCRERPRRLWPAVSVNWTAR